MSINLYLSLYNWSSLFFLLLLFYCFYWRLTLHEILPPISYSKSLLIPLCSVSCFLTQYYLSDGHTNMLNCNLSYLQNLLILLIIITSSISFWNKTQSIVYVLSQILLLALFGNPSSQVLSLFSNQTAVLKVSNDIPEAKSNDLHFFAMWPISSIWHSSSLAPAPLEILPFLDFQDNTFPRILP